MTSARRNPRVLGVWGTQGEGGTRVVASEAVWHGPVKWSRDKANADDMSRHLVFTASIADVFEQWDGPMIDSKGFVRSKVPNANQERSYWAIWDGDPSRRLTMDDCRLRMFDVIRRTPNLTYLLLTKRIEHVVGTLIRVARSVPGTVCRHDDLIVWLTEWAIGRPPANVWIGTTAEDQEWADRRVPELLKVPAVKRFVSYEPALGAVDWRGWCPCCERYWPLGRRRVNGNCDGTRGCRCDDMDCRLIMPPGINWLIVGGESGPHARPFDLAWARSARDQCRAAGVAFFCKQLGLRPFDSARRIGIDGPGSHAVAIALTDNHGADPDEWPADLRVQDFPS